MAKKSKYAVHPDFAHYPYMPFPFNGVFVSVLNRFLHLDTFLRQRHIKNKAKLHEVNSADGSRFKVFQFNPDNVADSQKLPALVYYHGGAFVLTYASTHVVSMNMYAQAANCRVFMVDYRLSPKHVFPKGFEDCYAAVTWLQKNADRLGVDPAHIVVGGDSAGGAFAAGVAQKARDEKLSPALAGQLLVYPVIDRHCNTASATQFVDTPMWNGVANKNMWNMYLRDFSTSAIPAYAAPGDRNNLSALAPAYVENAEFDPLRDEAEAYAKRLQADGVKTMFNPTKGTVHGYDTVFDSEICKTAFQRRLDFLKSVF